MIIPTSSYPLAWPKGVARTSNRRQWPRPTNPHALPRTIARAFDGVVHELKLASAKTIVVSSNLPLRADGQPYRDAPQRPGGDPGVAVYWTIVKGVWLPNEERWREEGTPHCMPCDRWTTLADNLHAIELSVNAMRGMERWGAVSLAQAFAGFAALPPGSPVPDAPTERPWREVLGGFPTMADFDRGDMLAVAKSRYRRLMDEHHPDRGGDPSIAAELNVAIAAAEQELSA